MKESKNFAVFILSHGRSDNVITYNTLRKQGYDGRIFIIVDDEDKSINQYKEKYGAEVIVFSKKDYAGKFDIMDNFDGNKVIVYARNACYDIARNLGLDYFFEYEDDYTSFQYKYPDKDILKAPQVKSLNFVLESMIDCLKQTRAATISFSQAGDHIGGLGTWLKYPAKRKAMNTFVFKVQKDKKQDLIFVGRMNDDVNAYLSLGKVGKLFFQTRNVCLVPVLTQASSGGNTEAYKAFGTYVKSFYSVMIAPSCCKIGMMGRIDMRIHHSIKWKNAVPKIIRESV
jgi:glycosyltransferase involved in cell wall biosynthesis